MEVVEVEEDDMQESRNGNGRDGQRASTKSPIACGFLIGIKLYMTANF